MQGGGFGFAMAEGLEALSATHLPFEFAIRSSASQLNTLDESLQGLDAKHTDGMTKTLSEDIRRKCGNLPWGELASKLSLLIWEQSGQSEDGFNKAQWDEIRNRANFLAGRLREMQESFPSDHKVFRTTFCALLNAYSIMHSILWSPTCSRCCVTAEWWIWGMVYSQSNKHNLDRILTRLQLHALYLSSELVPEPSKLGSRVVRADVADPENCLLSSIPIILDDQQKSSAPKSLQAAETVAEEVPQTSAAYLLLSAAELLPSNIASAAAKMPSAVASTMETARSPELPTSIASAAANIPAAVASIAETASTVASTASTKATDAAAEVQATAARFQSNVESLGSAVAAAPSNIVDRIQSLASTIVAAPSSLVKAASEALPEAAAEVQAKAAESKIIEAPTTAAETAVAKATEAQDEAAENIRSKAATIQSDVEAKASLIASETQATVSSIISQVQNKVQEAQPKLPQALKGVQQKVQEIESLSALQMKPLKMKPQAAAQSISTAISESTKIPSPLEAESSKIPTAEIPSETTLVRSIAEFPEAVINKIAAEVPTSVANVASTVASAASAAIATVSSVLQAPTKVEHSLPLPLPLPAKQQPEGVPVAIVSTVKTPSKPSITVPSVTETVMGGQKVFVTLPDTPKVLLPHEKPQFGSILTMPIAAVETPSLPLPLPSQQGVFDLPVVPLAVFPTAERSYCLAIVPYQENRHCVALLPSAAASAADRPFIAIIPHEDMKHCLAVLPAARSAAALDQQRKCMAIIPYQHQDNCLALIPTSTAQQQQQGQQQGQMIQQQGQQGQIGQQQGQQGQIVIIGL